MLSEAGVEGGHRGYTRQVLPASCSAAPRNPVAVPPSFFRLTLLRGVQPSDHVEGTSTGDTEAILALIKLPSMADDGRASCRLPAGVRVARFESSGPGSCRRPRSLLAESGTGAAIIESAFNGDSEPADSRFQLEIQAAGMVR